MVFLTVLSFFPYALAGPGLSEERCVIPSDNVYFDGCEYNKKKGRSKEVVSVETERGSSYSFASLKKEDWGWGGFR
jgi:hypothetical protein